MAVDFSSTAAGGHVAFGPLPSRRFAGHGLFQMADSEGSRRDVYTSFFCHVPVARKHESQYPRWDYVNFNRMLK